MDAIKYYICIKPFEVEHTDEDGYPLDDGSTMRVKDGSTWRVYAYEPNTMYNNNSSEILFNMEPEKRDSKYFMQY